MAVMTEQVSPVGQQIADFLLLKGMHVLVEGQQKLSGSPLRLHGVKPATEHVLALGRSPIACAPSSVIESAVTEGMVIEKRHTAASWREVIRAMVILCGELDIERTEYLVARRLRQKYQDDRSMKEYSSTKRRRGRSKGEIKREQHKSYFVYAEQRWS